MFEHQGGIRVDLVELGEVGPVIQVAQSGPGLVDVECEVILDQRVLGVTAPYLEAQLVEAFSQEIGVPEVAARAVYQVYGV